MSPQWVANWQKNKVYEAIRAARQGAVTFILHDEPPYANGDYVPINFKLFEDAYKTLTEKLRPMVFELGFLK